MSTLTRAIGAFAAFALAAALTACGPGTEESGKTADGEIDPSTTLAVADIAGDLETNLDAAGLLDDVPYKIDFVPIEDPSTIYPSLAANQLEVGVWGLDANGIAAIQNGAAARLVALFGPRETTEESQHQGLLNVIVSKESGIKTTTDLKGKTIATGAAGITPDVVLRSALADGGLTEDDVTIERHTGNTDVAAFLNGQVDALAGSLSSEQVIDAIDSGEAEILYYQNQATNISFLVASNDPTIEDEQKSLALEDFITRISKFYNWKADPANLDAYAKAISETTKAPIDAATSIAEYQATASYALPFDEDTTRRLEEDIQRYVNLGYLEKTIPVDEVINTKYNDAIVSAGE